jgi:hypothetical protein
MNLQKQQELDELYTRLLKFYDAKTDADLIKYLIGVVLELLVDCGAGRLK